jgi:hypothetical protein
MPTYFSKIVDRYFTQWIRMFTWDTMHPADMGRFYQFLKALNRYSRKGWDRSFRENIIKAAKDHHPDVGEDHLREMADFFTGKAAKCFAYESALFPDPLVERTNPYHISLHLRALQRIDDKGIAHPMYKSEQIEEIVTKEFGKNWRSQKRWKT